MHRRGFFWYWWRLKRRMWRAAAFVMRAGLVVSSLLAAFVLLNSIWPEVGNAARYFFAVVENMVRPTMERVAEEFCLSRERSAIRFAEDEDPVTAPVPGEVTRVPMQPNPHAGMRTPAARSRPAEPRVAARTPKSRDSVTVFRGDQVYAPTRPGKDGSGVRVLRGRPRMKDGSGVRAPRAGRGISGRARAVDGDTLDMNGMRIRLHGIDAPEHKQTCRVAGRRWPCGRNATRALASQVNGKPVVCDVRDRDSYGRVVAVCRIAGRDLNAWMVAEGWAFAYRRYSQAYVGEEARARTERRGVWRGEVVPPWRWRATQRR